MSLANRIAGAERAMSVLRPGLRVINIRGGLQSGVASVATIDGARLSPEPGESPDAFRARAMARAREAGSRTLIFGGLPPMSMDGADDE
jgi:hypothetical protein